ncbi:MAG TPA: hypothetical protein VFQ53_22155 [Kofleriaceae bacterium]|nr:hypothetical protein [Kofleriaceae bacterium]
MPRPTHIDPDDPRHDRSSNVEDERTRDPQGNPDDYEDVEHAREQRVSRAASPEADEEELAEDDILEELDDDDDDLDDDLRRMEGPDA